MSPTDKEFKMPYFRNVDEATLMQIEMCVSYAMH